MSDQFDDLLLAEEVHHIVGCAIEVLNALGPGLLEKPYENALCVEMRMRGIPFRQQPRFQVVYKGVPVGDYVPDIICYDKIVVDAKVVDQIGRREMGQMINYLKITGCPLGLLLNFRHSRLQWKRVALTRA